MQSIYSTVGGDLGGGFEIAVVGDGVQQDQVLIDFPVAQINAGVPPGRLTIPLPEVITCTKDDHYFFIAHAPSTAADATVYQIDLVAGTHKKLTLPNNHTQILGYIHSISPDAREHDPFSLTFDGKIIDGASQVIGYSCASLSGLLIIAIITTMIAIRLKKQQPSRA